MTPSLADSSREKSGWFRATSRIPGEYLDGFLKQQTGFIKSRVNLFCVLSISLYLFAVAMSFVIYPGLEERLEIALGVIFVLAAGLIIFFNARARSLASAKFNAYLFTVLMLAIIGKLGISYKDDAIISAATFVFTLFLVSSTIPWYPGEVVIIGVMHLIMYTFNFAYVSRLPGVPSAGFGILQYFDGFIFLVMALILCVIIRAKETVRDIENFVLFKEVEKRSDQMSRELELATRIHKTLVPGSIHSGKVDIAVSYLPIYYIGGDYAKYRFLENDRLIFIICDVTGHGVSSALLVNRIHAEFERFAREGERPGVLLKDLNDFIKRDFEGTEMYLSAFCGLLDFKKMSLVYSNHGHPPQYLYRAGGSKIERLKAQASLLGIPMDDNGVYESEVKVGEGDRILLFTDGVTEVMNERDVQYGDKRLEDFIVRKSGLRAEDFNRELLEDLNRFSSNKLKDDIFVLDIAIKGVEKAG